MIVMHMMRARRMRLMVRVLCVPGWSVENAPPWCIY